MKPFWITDGMPISQLSDRDQREEREQHRADVERELHAFARAARRRVDDVDVVTVFSTCMSSELLRSSSVCGLRP